MGKPSYHSLMLISQSHISFAPDYTKALPRNIQWEIRVLLLGIDIDDTQYKALVRKGLEYGPLPETYNLKDCLKYVVPIK